MKHRAGAVAALLAVALSAAGLLAASAPLHAEEELGRLFFTPQQRQDMDRRRSSNVQAAAPAAAVDQITVDGRVTRSSGENTTWINGVPQNNVRGGGANPDRVVIRGDDTPSTSLRVGETLDRTKGEKRDMLDGRISVHMPR